MEIDRKGKGQAAEQQDLSEEKIFVYTRSGRAVKPKRWE
jgi:hypothetical protein